MEHVSQLAHVIQSMDTITSEEPNKCKQLMEVEEFGQFTEKLLQLVQEMISSEILKHSLQVCVCAVKFVTENSQATFIVVQNVVNFW